jgi:hypothetical protein|tara:strand:+ start:173 stop:790 length:618 start_codon:yes stop_codon:yes gene_type:complete
VPIFHHTKTHGRFFFIHIPRTAGRFLVVNFWRNDYDIEHHLTKERIKEKEVPNYLWTPAEGVEISHTHYSLYSKWKSSKDLPSIAIVRNPIDKFFSGSKRLAPGLQSSLENWTTYKNFFSTKKKNNLWRPQHEFVSPHTNIWKYEDGFGKNFCDWINNILPINFSIKTNIYEKQNYDQSPGLIKTTTLIDHTKKFYRQDFEKFDY